MECKKCGQMLPEGASFCPNCGKPTAPLPKKGSRRGNNQGCAIKEGHGWSAVYSLSSYTEKDGDVLRLNRIRKHKRGFKTKTEALIYAQNHSFGEEEIAPPKIGTLYDEWYEKNKDTLKGARKYANSKARERLNDLMGIRIDKLRTKQMQDCIDRNCNSHDTAKDCKTLLSKIYKLAIAYQYVTTNLAEYLTVPKAAEDNSAAFTAEDLKKMWDAYMSGDKWVGYLLLMCYSGMMPGEILRCRRDQVNLETCEIYGCGLKTAKRKTTAIAFPEMLRPLVADLLTLDSKNSRAKNEKLVNQNKDNFYDRYRETIKKYGLSDINLYSTRHTTATMAATNQVTAPTIQQIMRHSQISTTQHYIHNMSDSAHAAIDAVAEATIPADIAERLNAAKECAS